MPAKPLMLLASSLVTAGLVVAPLAADARGLGQAGTWGKPAGPPVSNLTCGTSLGAMPQMSLPHISSKTSNIYKPVTITSTIDASRNISIIKNIDNSKTIDASKHIEINKSVVIQKIINSNNNNTNNNTNTNNNNSTSDATAQALATAIANLNSTIQVTNNNSSQGGTGGGNITVIATGGNAEGG
ncbi:MAG TPA: hypothetical protein VEM35_08780, partial [Rhizomicrobium sp.]|nr:hypothetical protein [Rhizomicrobium sp.]